MADFTILPVDLGVARSNPTKIVDPRQLIYSVTVMSLPAGASASLFFGNNKQAMALQEGDVFDDHLGEPIEKDGLFLTNAAQAGVTLELFIAYSPLRLGRQ